MLDNVFVGEYKDNEIEVKFKITYKPDSAVVICKSKNIDWSQDYYFDFVKHIIKLKNGDSYYMHRYPLHLVKFVLPFWEAVLENYPYHYLMGGLINDNYEYLEHLNLRLAKRVKESKTFERKKWKDYMPEVYNHVFNDETLDFLFVSSYKEEDIIFAINILTGRIGILYQEKETVYNAKNFPKKYYRYIDLYLDFIIHKMMAYSSKFKSYDKYFELERDWKLLKSDVKSYLSDKVLDYPLV